MAPERFFLELDPPAATQASWPHVVVVGGGFAGVRVCQALARQPVRVTLIDKRNFNLFQPLLYQVASGLVSAADVASPLRQMVGQAPNVQVLLGEVTDLDLENRSLRFNGHHYGYDQLVLACGSGSTYFGHEEWRPLAPPMKILEHAQEIRRRLLMALEEAEQTTDPQRRQFLQSVVVVGAGPAGCELAGSLVELMHSAIRRDFKQLQVELCRVVLVDAVDRVLPTMHPSLSAAAAEYLERNGVELCLGSMVGAIEPGKVLLKEEGEPRFLEAATVCWTAGVRASRLGKLLAERSGCAVDRLGRVLVEPDFSVPGHPELRVVGDLCSYGHTSDGAPLPGMAGPAVQMGSWVAGDILRQIKGEVSPPFRWLDLGSMAVIGPLFAVADLRGLRVTGLLGWLLWGLAHLAFIPATENRITLLTRWLWQIATRQRSALLITGRPEQHIGVDVGLTRAPAATEISEIPGVSRLAAPAPGPGG
ncbi:MULTISPECIES: NAD(P)/FAD-dependent oxidoreductase [Synechococcaceae]|uniref:NAD(P)/FAD-dependent oxidoreductase n=1 Tax=Synechococcaceae TaxID=1890426 RepID=UPI0008FF61AA|nr:MULTISPECIES: NAD(P)/FAD-dependent oxidoreductase [Synechococcaceae]MCT4365059.1 NAD(P)/FAD-dependent oxidoreductase [Candidatus Regnicoccus frigidus MAG-AL1]APD49188.1 N-acetylglucosamine-1-phosphate uridyltransferase [Synechococcus sp. SynAce01]MCT0202129.1 NAD(P)/FAD-dependent oxidoreductase [Synechococcus sp. CS-603]MCT0244907.1 NAD(P)/FAD-dependent oxidoreductase [Synechococcus sp. CS-601]MCT4367787.1 NAD(P)/FAD-dependent oxidoreductase [Candidatus Regnicoccus frigidus MAG-AL2]